MWRSSEIWVFLNHQFFSYFFYCKPSSYGDPTSVALQNSDGNPGGNSPTDGPTELKISGSTFTASAVMQMRQASNWRAGASGRNHRQGRR